MDLNLLFIDYDIGKQDGVSIEVSTVQTSFEMLNISQH